MTDVLVRGPTGAWHSFYSGAVLASVKANVEATGLFRGIVGQHDPAGPTKFVRTPSGIWMPLDTFTVPMNITKLAEDEQVNPGDGVHRYFNNLPIGNPSPGRHLVFIVQAQGDNSSRVLPTENFWQLAIGGNNVDEYKRAVVPPDSALRTGQCLVWCVPFPTGTSASFDLLIAGDGSSLWYHDQTWIFSVDAGDKSLSDTFGYWGGFAGGGGGIPASFTGSSTVDDYYRACSFWSGISNGLNPLGSVVPATYQGSSWSPWNPSAGDPSGSKRGGIMWKDSLEQPYNRKTGILHTANMGSGVTGHGYFLSFAFD